MTIAELLRPQSVKSSSLVCLLLQVSPLLTVQDVKRVKPKFNSQAASDPLCKFCGLRHSFSHPSKCLAFKQQCRKSKKEGHFARVCKTSTKQNNVNPVEEALATETDPDNVPHTYFDLVELGCWIS